MPRNKKKNLPIEKAISRTLAVVMGGGAGSRLFPLTLSRSKPAVPLAGKYRIVDIPISNCINAGLRQVYVLTQFNSASLNRHINHAYKFDNFSASFVDILAAQQTPDDQEWYQGTADAVRQNLRHFEAAQYDRYLILSGDQLYRMNFRDLIADHLQAGSDLTIATLPVERGPARDFGIMHADADSKISRFVEKPQEDALLDELAMPPGMRERVGIPDDTGDRYLASMGIYLFEREALFSALDNDLVDFGKNVIPRVIEDREVRTFVHQGYWEDIGTIRSFYEANLELCRTLPAYDFFDSEAPIFTHARFLPASKVNEARIKRSILSDGCIITDATIENCVVGLRSVIRNGATVRNTVMMGADFYEEAAQRGDQIPIGIGEDSRIDSAIIDKDARIGAGVILSPEGMDDVDTEHWYVRDGIIVVPKGARIAPGTVIKRS